MAEEKKKKDRSKWFREMRSELKKVVWPNASTTAKNSGTVLLCSLVVGACIWLWMVLVRWKKSKVVIDTPDGSKEF